MRHFMQMQQEKWDQGFFACVGLDSDLLRIPQHVRTNDVTETLFLFNKAIVEHTFDVVSHYKPQISFYEQLGMAGIIALKKTIAFINAYAPSVPVILDAKRGDIGSTNNGYVVAAFDYLGADAITVHPWLGGSALQPFLELGDKGIIVLCRTSNDDSNEFQGKYVSLSPEELSFFLEHKLEHLISPEGMIAFYQYVAYRVSHFWNQRSNCCLVMGATYPEEMKFVRDIVGDMPFLIPGIGAQQGDLALSVAHGKNSRSQGMIFNNARGVIFASSGHDFAMMARQNTVEMHKSILDCLH